MNYLDKEAIHVGDNRQGFMLGILIGGIVGAAAALLYAPEKGDELRGQVKQKARDARDRASELAESVKGSAEDLTAKSKGYVETKKAQVHAAVEAGRQAAAEKKAELQSPVEEPKASI